MLKQLQFYSTKKNTGFQLINFRIKIIQLQIVLLLILTVIYSVLECVFIIYNVKDSNWVNFSNKISILKEREGKKSS